LEVSIEISLHEDTAKSIETGDRMAIVKALDDNIKEEEDELDGFLSGFCTGGRETFLNESLTVRSVEPKDDLTGTVYVSLSGYAHMGCPDISDTTEYDATLEYEIDIEGQTITLTGDYPEEREPDQY
jgi:hypothetical protein